MTRPYPGPFCPRLLILVSALFWAVTCCEANIAEEESWRTRDFQTLNSDSIRQLVELDPPAWSSVDEGHLGKLLILRPSGSENNTLVQNYISSVFYKLGWHEERTPFTSSTPIGEIEFTNLIYTFDPEAPRKVVLAAHFDSKWFPAYPANQFIGATDSAAPCAMLLDLAEALTPLLQAQKQSRSDGEGPSSDDAFAFDFGDDEDRASETTLQLLFFDGEEAFHDWTDTDSIYGARYLAEEWASTYLPPSHPLSLTKRRFDPTPTILNTIDHLILLDLLGNSHSSIYSYFRETDWLHTELRNADKRLIDASLVEVEKGEENWFPLHRMRKGMIGDDHVPFLQRGVSILHVISSPFPQVWHTLADDATALSLPAMRRWNSILRVFVAEYLGLNPATAVSSRRTEEYTIDEPRHSRDDLVSGVTAHL